MRQAANFSGRTSAPELEHNEAYVRRFDAPGQADKDAKEARTGMASEIASVKESAANCWM